MITCVWASLKISTSMNSPLTLCHAASNNPEEPSHRTDTLNGDVFWLIYHRVQLQRLIRLNVNAICYRFHVSKDLSQT